MSVLLREIKHTNSTAASVLERADFCTDSEIQSLTREDLHELFPGPEKLKLRRVIFGIIHKQKPIDLLLKELKDFIPHDSLRDALSRNGVLVDYLYILKDLRAQVDHVQHFLEVHISLLEDISQTQPDQQPDRGVLPGTSASAPHVPVEQGIPADIHPYGAHVMYQMVVSGKTSDAYLQLMARVQCQVQDRVQLISCSQGGQITIVFCKIVSHARTDIDAIMTYVADDAPIILVLMHHTHKVKHSASMKPWSDYSNVVLYVNVFYHEAAHGLLRCQENTFAVSQIKEKLLEFSIPRNNWGVNGVYNGNENVPGYVNDDAGSEFGVRLFNSSSSGSSSTSSSDSESKSIWEGGE